MKLTPTPECTREQILQAHADRTNAQLSVGESLLRCMSRSGVTVIELSKRSGLSRHRIQKIFCGADNIRLGDVVFLFSILGCPCRVRFSTGNENVFLRTTTIKDKWPIEPIKRGGVE